MVHALTPAGSSPSRVLRRHGASKPPLNPALRRHALARAAQEEPGASEAHQLELAYSSLMDKLGRSAIDQVLQRLARMHRLSAEKLRQLEAIHDKHPASLSGFAELLIKAYGITCTDELRNTIRALIALAPCKSSSLTRYASDLTGEHHATNPEGRRELTAQILGFITTLVSPARHITTYRAQIDEAVA